MDKKIESKYIGVRFGMLIITEKVGTVTYVVKCDCGEEKVRYINNIKVSMKRGGIVSCGCMKGYNVSKKLIGKENHRKIHFTKEQVDRMVELHIQGVNLRQIGKEFGVTENPIKIQLELRGRTVGNRRYEVTENYFKTVDSEEKAYWLGFLAADGCIRRRVNNQGKTRGDGIYLKLSVLDEGHLKKFRDSICPDAQIYYHTNKTKTKKGNLSISNSCNLGVYSNELVRDIMKLGVGPRKTFTITKPNIDPKYYRDYIRGLFDGDGCCYIRKTKNKYGHEYVSANYSFASASTSLREFLSEELNKVGIGTSCTDKLNLCVIGGFIGNKKFFDYLYTGATIFLERKYNKGLELIEQIIVKDGHIYKPIVRKINGKWTEEELNILIETNDKIPYTYLSGEHLPNKTVHQIFKMRKKLGLKSRRKIPGFLDMRKQIKGF